METARSLDTALPLSVVMPVFNEAANLEAAVNNVRAVLDGYDPEYEIIVVDDGSRDDSAGICRDLQARDRRVRLVTHGTNLGYGAAVRTGMLACTGELIVLFPADRQFDPADLPGLIAMAADYDIVIGRRTRRADPWHRRLLGACWSWLIRQLVGLPVRDVNSGVKVYRRNRLEWGVLRANSALIDAEILAQAVGRGCSVAEAAIRHYPRTRGQATGSRPSVIARSLVELVAMRGELRRQSAKKIPGRERTRYES